MRAIVELYDKKETYKFYKIKHTDCCSFVSIFKDDFDIINYRTPYTPSDAIIKCPRCGKELKFRCKMGKDTSIDIVNSVCYNGYIEEISEDEYKEYLSKAIVNLRVEL